MKSRFPRFLTNGKSLIHNHLHRVTAITAGAYHLSLPRFCVEPTMRIGIMFSRLYLRR